ncbi:MAG: hypothetical protein QOI66_5424 [Myxococcales bacterium]|jgi:hypothetical protein|nr:hypothetical protein [Myxococcales bacterium]
MLLRIGVLSLSAALALGCTTSGIKTGSTGTGNNGGGNTSGGGGASGTGGIKDPTGGPNCGMKTFGLQKVPPDLMIVQDKSGSMDQSADGMSCGRGGCAAMGKWAQMTAAINQVVMQTETQIRWGLKYFPDAGNCGVGAMPAVPIAPMNAAAIGASIMTSNPNGGTPTRTAVAGASMYMATLADPNPKFLLLATDGLPNCLPGGGSSEDDSMGAIQAVTDSAAMGIPVFVVGIGTVAEAQTTLTAMAVAGGVPQAMDPKYYPVSSTAELVNVLGTIGGMIGSCSFGLGSAPPDPTNIAVTSGGMKIPPDPTHMNGWDYGTGKLSVQLYGKYCDDAKAGKLTDIKAIFGCPGVIIP